MSTLNIPTRIDVTDDMVELWVQIAAEAAAKGPKMEDGLPRFTFSLTKPSEERSKDRGSHPLDLRAPHPALYCVREWWWEVIVRDRATGRRSYLTTNKLEKTIRFAARDGGWFISRLYNPTSFGLTNIYEACDLIGLVLKWPEFARSVVPYEAQSTGSVYTPVDEDWFGHAP